MEVNEPAVAYSRQKMTIEEYLAFENAATEKHEYYQGEVFAMSGAKITHNLIMGNVFGALLNFLDGKKCIPVNSEQRIYIEKNTLFTYPDMSVFCDDIVFLNNDEWNAMNPSIIIEVLSPSTKKYDRGLKFTLYKDNSTLKEYILIDSENIHVEVFTISQDGDWHSKQYRSIDEAVSIATIQMELAVSRIYKGTKLLNP